MINKKIGVMTLGLTLMMLASCGPNSNKGNYVPPKAEGSDNITYFCPSTDVKYMEEVVAAFKAANPDYTGEITLQAEIGEGDVKAEVQKDINAAADVVLLADDNVPSSVPVASFPGARKKRLTWSNTTANPWSPRCKSTARPTASRIVATTAIRSSTTRTLSPLTM